MVNLLINTGYSVLVVHACKKSRLNTVLYSIMIIFVSVKEKDYGYNGENSGELYKFIVFV